MKSDGKQINPINSSMALLIPHRTFSWLIYPRQHRDAQYSKAFFPSNASYVWSFLCVLYVCVAVKKGQDCVITVALGLELCCMGGGNMYIGYEL